MRLQNLSLDRFGHFTDQSFDFGTASDGRDFHIIYGANEAGKTTTMEAMLRLFYGFPHREGYAFKHPRSNLQVSATLEIDGVPRRFTRLPTRSGSLVDETGTPLPEAALSAHLAGLSEEDYRRLLCLDDETIERGGEEIANAQGDIGRLLFSAAAGVADLSAVLEGVRDRADALWKKRGRTTRMAELKRALAEVEKEIKDRDVTASAWKGLKRDLATARKTEQDARRIRDALNTTRARMDAQKRALPLVSDILDLKAAIAPYASYPNHLDFDPERLIELRSDRGLAMQNIARLTEDIAKLRDERAGHAVDADLLDLSAKLEDLEELSARDRTAQLDLARREEEQQAAEAAMRQAARELGIASPDVDLQRLVLSAADIAILETAREALRAALSQVETEAREVTELKDRVAAATEALQDGVPETEKTPRVADTLVRFDVDSLAPIHATALQAIDAARFKANRSLSALSRAGVSFDRLPPCPTTLHQAQDWAERHDALARDLRALTERRDDHLADLEARRAQAEALTKVANVVSDADASDLRERRDALWAEHLTALDRRTADAFHAAMQQHDTAAATRLTQSRERAQLREIGQAEAEARARAVEADKRLARLSEECTAIEVSTAAAAAKVGLPTTIPPTEWLDWVENHQAASKDAQVLREVQEANRVTLERAEALLAALAEILPFKPTDLGSALSAARRLAEDEHREVEARSKAEDALRQAQRDLARRQTRHTDALTAKETAETAWLVAIRERLGESLPPERLAASLEPLRELREHEAARAAAERRIRTMKADQTQFGQEVAALARAHDLPPQSTPAETYSALKDLAEEARMAQESVGKLDASIATAEADMARHSHKLAAIDQEIEAIASVFPDAATLRDIDALRQVAARAQQVIEDRTALEKLERQILSELDAADLEMARSQLADRSVAALEALLESNKSDLNHAEDALTRAIQDSTRAEQALSDVKADDEIAELVEQKATLELEQEEAALEHLELSLGHRLASDAIRRYRDSHRSGMLTATERCFASLTHGAYPSLSTQIDKDAEILLAVDGNGVSKRAAEMSKGTRFQLYLALRAAAHEQLVGQGTTLPFFCDDIFETFDEARTSAACRVMETIGGRGQAIYLTHHRHVVDIAKSVCTTPPIVHEL